MKIMTVAFSVLFAFIMPAQAEEWDDYQRLTTEQIRQAFAGVRDDASVQDGDGGSAINYWYDNGQFIVHWQTSTQSGVVKGRWYAEDDQRCILIASGLPELEGNTRCGAIYRKDGLYYSVNKNGGVHAIHHLTRIDTVDE